MNILAQVNSGCLVYCVKIEWDAIYLFLLHFFFQGLIINQGDYW